MSTKPTDTVRFAVDDADDSDASNIASPADALRDTGYATNAIPTSANFNYFLNRYHRWLVYLDDGDFQDPVTFASEVTVGDQPYAFADKTFTADHTLELFTAVAHGFETGDGPVRVSNSGGALPAGLSAGTDYWVVFAFTDSFRLATSRQNALNSVFLAITTNGTGTHTVADTAGTTRLADAHVTRNLLVDNILQVGGNAVVFGELQLQSLNLLGDAAIGDDLTVVGDVGVSGTVTTVDAHVTDDLTVDDDVAVGGDLNVTGGALVGSGLGVTGPLTAGNVVTATGLITANGGLTTSSGVTFTGAAEEHHPDRVFSIDCSGFLDDFLNDGSQGVLLKQTLVGVSGIFRSFFVGAGNGSGELGLCAPLHRIRAADKIKSVEVCFARLNTPDGNETLELYENGNTTASDNAVFTSSTLTRPGANAIASTVVTVNHTHTTSTGLRLRIKTTSTGSGGTMYLRWVIVTFERP